MFTEKKKMSIFVFSLAVSFLLVCEPSAAQSQGTVCQTAEVTRSYGAIKCVLTRLFRRDKSCKDKTTKLVCITLPTTVTLPPPTTTDPVAAMDCSVDTFFADSNDPTQYYQCQGSTPTLFKCPVLSNSDTGATAVQVWDQYTRSCMITPEADVTCVQPDGRQKHPFYCNMYIECKNNVPSKIRCHANFGYNDTRKDCVINNCDTL